MKCVRPRKQLINGVIIKIKFLKLPSVMNAVLVLATFSRIELASTQLCIALDEINVDYKLQQCIIEIDAGVIEQDRPPSNYTCMPLPAAVVVTSA